MIDGGTITKAFLIGGETILPCPHLTKVHNITLGKTKKNK